jgi:hypothetical protein
MLRIEDSLQSVCPPSFERQRMPEPVRSSEMKIDLHDHEVVITIPKPKTASASLSGESRATATHPKTWPPSAFQFAFAFWADPAVSIR